MTKRFLLVVGVYKAPISEQRWQRLKAALNVAPDWLSMNAGLIVIFTDLTVDQWYISLRELLEEEDRILISEFDPKSAQGRLPKWVWDWLLADRSSGAYVDIPKTSTAILAPKP